MVKSPKRLASRHLSVELSSAFLQFYGWWISETDCCQHQWHKAVSWDLCASAEDRDELRWVERICWFGPLCCWRPGWVLEERPAPMPRGWTRWLVLALPTFPVSNFPGGPALNHTHESSRDLWKLVVGSEVRVLTCGSTPLMAPRTHTSCLPR